MEFSGRLASFPIGDILQWAQNDRRSGALVVRRSGAEKRVYLLDGDIVACYSDDAAEYFGQYLLTRGLLAEADLIRALTHCQKRGGRLGRVLVELGLLGTDEMRAALREHVEDLVCELFLWKTGIFYFTTESVPADQTLPAPLPAAALALEGSRRADEYLRIRRLFVHDHVALVAGKRAAESPSPLAARILAAVDGERTLRELYSEVRGSWYRFLETAYRLAVDGALDIGEVHDPSDTTHSTELRLADLLIEQVAEEQSVFLKQHLAIPFEALESFVPVWVRPPDAAEEARASGAVRKFYEQIDARRDLAALLGGVDRDERVRRMDRLVLQLRKGALALLPAASEALEAAAEEAGRPAGARWWRRLRGAVNR
jgi:hypothetical protein